MDYEENQKTTKLLDYLEALKDCESESILTYNFIKSRALRKIFFIAFCWFGIFIHLTNLLEL